MRPIGWWTWYVGWLICSSTMRTHVFAMYILYMLCIYCVYYTYLIFFIYTLCNAIPYINHIGFWAASGGGAREHGRAAEAWRRGTGIYIYVVHVWCCLYGIIHIQQSRNTDSVYRHAIHDILNAIHYSIHCTYACIQAEAQLARGDTIYRVTAMFSATMPPEVESIAKSYLRHPVIIKIGISVLFAYCVILYNIVEYTYT